MNTYERRMLEILKEGKEKYEMLSVKAEFEAEGTRTEELLRLLEVARRAAVGVAIKIGGCEAVRDLLEARQFGVDYVIAPMVETPYALSKYVDAKNKVFAEDERRDIKFLYNLETVASYRNLDGLMQVARKSNGVDGVVFGRVDFVGSLGKNREAVHSDEVVDCICEVARHCKDSGLELVVGGAVTLQSAPSLRKVREIHLDRFETRKIVFSAELLERDDVEEALALAGEFELLWLQNKRAYYLELGNEDQSRIEMLSKRFAKALVRAA